MVPGQTTDTFRRQPLPQWEQLSFSLLYRSLEDGQPRTLDLICKSQPEHDLWFNGLQVWTALSPLLQGESLGRAERRECGRAERRESGACCEERAWGVL